MDLQKINQYKSSFDLIAKEIKDDNDNNIEVWYARELQTQLGYARWENFVVAIGRAMESCKTWLSMLTTIFVRSQKWFHWIKSPHYWMWIGEN